jgi:hypothetical protein
VDLHDPVGIEQGIAAFAKGSNNGLIVTGSPSATLQRDLIIYSRQGTSCPLCTTNALTSPPAV